MTPRIQILALLLALPLQAEHHQRNFASGHLRSASVASISGSETPWKRALPGYTYQFPRDHFSHPDFKTEWWYATGNLESKTGHTFGFQFTIFRQGIRPPGSQPKTTSRFVRDHFYFAHIAISDIGNREFYFAQLTSRGAFDEAGSPVRERGRPARRQSEPGSPRGAGIPARRQSEPGSPRGAGIPARRQSEPGSPRGAGIPARKPSPTAEPASPPWRHPEPSGERRRQFATADPKDTANPQPSTRGAFGEAGSPPNVTQASLPVRAPTTLAFLPGAQIRLTADSKFEITAKAKSAADGKPFELTLTLDPKGNPPIIQGKDGVSQKSAGEGHASHYYSFPNLDAKGTITLGDKPPVPVTGKSWLDREWSTSMLAKNQVGWDWFAIRLDDGRQLMLYQLRLKDGTPDPASSGTLIAKDRTKRHLTQSEFTLEPIDTWKSPHTGARYPSKWRIRIPGEKIDLTATAQLADQELALPVVQYYEGAISISGSHLGEGYMELTGYTGPLTALTP